MSCGEPDVGNISEIQPSSNTCENGMVSSAHPLASQIGVDIMKQGGNAFDAAVAVQFALAVVYPRAGNIAGGGFAVFRTGDGELGSLDFREKAPLKSHRDMYIDDTGEVIHGQSLFGGKSVGVPGTVDGMITLHEKYGLLSFSSVIQPAIDLAVNGFSFTEREANKLNQFQKEFYDANFHSMPFLKDKGWQKGDSVKLLDLAKTLERIRDSGRNGFYTGKTAELITKEIERGGGILSMSDLRSYSSVWRKPIISNYKDYQIISMGPPSSGGIIVLQLLKGIEDFDLSGMKHNSTEYVHLLTELERRSYADRATHLGDPDFYDVPVDMLLDTTYIKKRNANISMAYKTNSREIKEGDVEVIESIETTHFSIVDKDRNAVALTTTLNGNYGSKVFVEGGGFFLNNQMDDFSIQPGYPNQFGLVGAEANSIEPEKRMLSSMSPTIVERDGELFMLLGTPGGSTIITSVFQTILNVVEFDMELQEAIDAKKVHHQWLPDKILYERNELDSVVINELMEMGHILEARNPIGKIDAILINENGNLVGGADTTRGDDVAIGY